MQRSQTIHLLMTTLALAVFALWSPAAQAQQNVVLYDNGPLITHTNACGSNDASRLQQNLGLGILGFGNRFVDVRRVSDDFTVPAGGWTIDSITFYAYQTSAPSTPSPITGLYVQIWDGPPDNATSSVVWGDLTTNRLNDSSFSNIQRDSDVATCSDNRYIFANTALVGTSFAPGTYWIDWMTDGNSSYSGPFAPPVTILGQTTTGNALLCDAGVWSLAFDSEPQDLPFSIRGPECLTDDNCTEGEFCDEGICRFPCELFIRYKEIRSQKLTRDRKWVFFVTGEEDFDLFGLIDFGPFTWQKVFFNNKKDRLKIIATVPAGLAPGAYPVSVGECSGEIIVTGSDR